MARNSYWPVTGLGNKGLLNVLNGTKLVLDDHGNNLDSFRINLESFRSFRGHLLPKPATCQQMFFAVSYSKPALVKALWNWRFRSSFNESDFTWCEEIWNFLLSEKLNLTKINWQHKTLYLLNCNCRQNTIMVVAEVQEKLQESELSLHFCQELKTKLYP